jgi:hypothetical protein
MPKAPPSQDSILIVGEKQIAKTIGIGFQHTASLLHKGDLPAVKLGQYWVSTKPRLEAWADNLLACNQGKTILRKMANIDTMDI